MTGGKNKDKKGIFAAIGAATGLGNAFRFPALCVSYGAAFIFAYAAALAVVCFPLLCAELNFGRRKTVGKGARVWSAIMRAAAVNSAVIALYYGVISAKLGSACLSFAAFGQPTSPADTLFTCLVLAAMLAAVFFVLRGGARALAHTGRASVTLSLLLFSVLALFGICRGGAFSSLDFSVLARGSVWVDALGQALLALSLAGGVMPQFARTRPDNFSVPRTAFAVVGANFCGCILAALSTLPFVTEFPAQGGVSCALVVFPQVVRAVAGSGLAYRLTGVLLYAVFTIVAIHSLCSLAFPVILKLQPRFPRCTVAFCLACAIIAPLFLYGDGAVLSACDLAACSVVAVVTAFSESLFFAVNIRRKGLPSLFIRFICPPTCAVLALFSVCSARFSAFLPVAALCAYAVIAAALFAAALPPLLRKFKNRKFKKLAEKISDRKG